MHSNKWTLLGHITQLDTWSLYMCKSQDFQREANKSSYLVSFVISNANWMSCTKTGHRPTLYHSWVVVKLKNEFPSYFLSCWSNVMGLSSLKAMSYWNDLYISIILFIFPNNMSQNVFSNPWTIPFSCNRTRTCLLMYVMLH